MGRTAEEPPRDPARVYNAPVHGLSDAAAGAGAEAEMKVVLFCGGLGTRIRDYSENVPKPLVPIGARPILVNLMQYYAHHGHREFILCLGYRGDAIKEYFLDYNECLSNDFVLSKGGREIELLHRDIDDWIITFVDTGLHANIGERLLAVEKHLEGESAFLANYSDGLTDLPLNRYVEDALASDCVASLLAVPAPHAFHIVDADASGRVQRLQHVGESVVRINGGFFVFRREIFDYIQPGEELVHEPFRRLIAKGKLRAHPYDGFWASMDTFKDKQRFEDLLARGQAPWQVWKR
jgi:glucose-1-phosphate cytidylyltransferase